MLSLDTTTRAEYDAATTAVAKAQAVLDALGATVTVAVYDGSNTLMGSGVMQSPWATRTNAVLTVGEVGSFAVTSSGTPDSNWYLRFEGNSRWIRGSFGLTASGADFTWSLPTWESGQGGLLGTITATSTTYAVDAYLSSIYDVGSGAVITFGWTVPDGFPISLPATGGNYDLAQHLARPVGVTPTYALTTPITGVSVSPSTGVLIVAPGAAAGTYSATVTADDNVGAGAVTNLAASLNQSTLVRLTWTAAPGATAYEAGRSSNGGATWATLTTSLTATTYDDTTVAASTAYQYRVRGLATAGNGAYATLNVTTPAAQVIVPTQVTGLVVAQALWNSVALSWAAATNATSYGVERSANGGTSWAQLGTPTGTTYTDTTVTASTAYQYRVRAFNATTPGLYSSAVSTTTLAAPAAGSFAARASDPSVVWAHDFTYPEEFTQFINGVDPYTTAYPPNLIPRREAVTVNGRSTYGFVYTFIGGRLAAPLPIGATAMTLVDATDFPDPNDPEYSCVPYSRDGNYPTPGYYLWIQTNLDGARREPNASGTLPATRERVYVTAKSGNTLTVRRGQYKGVTLDWPDASGALPYVGNEPSGDWDRPLSGFAAGQNGKPVADNNAGRPITRTWTAGRHGTYYREGAGWYAHPDYDSLPDPLNGTLGTWYGYSNWREGRDYYISWAMWVDPARFEGLNETVTSKLVWMGDIAGSTATHELVMSVDPTYSPYDVTPSGHATGRIFCYTGFGNQKLQDPFSGSGAKSFQPGSQWAGTCLVGASNQATNLCFTLPLGEWVTFMAHVITGHDETSYFDGGDTGLEVFVAQGGQWVTVFRKLDMGIKYGGANNPPGFNTFHPARYYNASLSQIPGKTFRTKYTELILSNAPILPPA